MGVKIYFFTGTGNSLAVARDLALRTNGEAIPIPYVINRDKIMLDDDQTGIVFPVYNQGIPFIIKRFVSKIESASGKYIFSVCTCGNNPGLSLKYLDNLLKPKGGRLSAGFSVKMPYNYVSPTMGSKDFYRSFKLTELPPDKQQLLFNAWKSKAEEISDCIIKRQKKRIETRSVIIEGLVDLLNLREKLQKPVWLKIGGFKGKTDLSYTESIQLMDNGFSCDEKCKGCGICSKVCPVKNIIMVDGQPHWEHHCEQCFACLQWCPKEAIQFSCKTPGQKRYHHPDVSVSDIIAHSQTLN